MPHSLAGKMADESGAGKFCGGCGAAAAATTAASCGESSGWALVGKHWSYEGGPFGGVVEALTIPVFEDGGGGIAMCCCCCCCSAAFRFAAAVTAAAVAVVAS